MAQGPASLAVEHLHKSYGSNPVVTDVSLTIPAGSLVSFLGPSGCGKTTILRMIAGFVAPTAGRVLVRDRAVDALPPYKRDMGMVFQNYALFPHMNIARNVAFGLEVRGCPRPQIREAVQKALAMVQLDGKEDRLPRQLSGGQQQRVALARALVINPSVLLLDEPLSNLDAKLRQEMRVEIRALQQRIGITAVFVTHDQDEALALSDQVVVLNHGRVEQVGTPREVYERPATPFVARFMGNTNLVSVNVVGTDRESVQVRMAGGAIFRCAAAPGAVAGQNAHAALRPERLQLCSPDEPGSLACVIKTVTYQGHSTLCEVELPEGLCLRVLTARTDLSPGDPAGVQVEAAGAHLILSQTQPQEAYA